MKRVFLILLGTMFVASGATAKKNDHPSFPRSFTEDKRGYMSEAYWKHWNEEEQAQIDADIEKYRKADAKLEIKDLGRNRKVKIEQISHEFIFGAHIFNFNQLGKKEYNDRYKRSYGELFNSATVPFYWTHLEWERGKVRFETAENDTEEWWNNCTEPQRQFHWRRPSTDQIVDFCEQKGIRAHGHVLVWGSRGNGMARWWPDLMTPAEMETWKTLFTKKNLYANKAEKGNEKWNNLTLDEIAKLFPDYPKALDNAWINRIKQIAERYKGRIQSWDVVNESADDNGKKWIPENHPVSRSRRYSLMSGDYPYKALKWAEEYFPKEVKLNINDFRRSPTYTAQVKRLQERGCKIDIMGIQMHIFNTKKCLAMAEGAKTQTPKQVRKYIGWASETGLPLHMSEITIASPSQDERGLMIQAILAQNLYRLWFSQKNMMGITWWNTVDGCGLKGEPAVSGIFFRDMKEKPVYWALDQLINHEWKTNTTVKADKNGNVEFRGFKGKYRITYKDNSGKTKTMEYTLK
ncbi:MAG: endo-1,4-beta-xylanase [Alistipes sp.]|nr:endo-1,4-beta-xylanase [Alistipes sp.]